MFKFSVKALLCLYLAAYASAAMSMVMQDSNSNCGCTKRDIPGYPFYILQSPTQY